MPNGERAVTVLACDVQVDLSVRDDLTPARVVPYVLRAVSEAADGAADATAMSAARRTVDANPAALWRLCTELGAPLAEDVPLATAGVRDGDLLRLEPKADGTAPLVSALLSNGRPAPTEDSWTVADSQRFFAGTGVVLALAGIAAILAMPTATRWIVAAGAAAAWTELGVVLARGTRLVRAGRGLSGTAAIAAVPLWLIAGATMPLPAHTLLNRIGAVALAGVVASVGMATFRCAVTRTLAVAGAVLGITVLGAVGSAVMVGGDVAVAAEVLAVIDTIMLRCAARIAVLLRPTLRIAGDAVRAAMTAVLYGVGVGLLASWAVLAWVVGRGDARTATTAILCLSVAVALVEPRALRFRRHRQAATAVAAAGALSVAGAVVLRMTSPVAVLGTLAAAGCIALVAGTLWHGLRLPVWMVRAAELGQLLAVTALVPVLVALLGGYDVVTRLAHGWVG
ncbi:MAG: EsaB/YukD family protein [Jatrophihabitans sp.]